MESVLILSTPQEISLPELLEGRLPETPDECAIEQELVKRWGFSVGQRVNVETTPLAGIDPLLQKDFVITGVFKHPEHVSFMVSVKPYLLVLADSFNREGLEGAFMKTRILVEDAPKERFSEAYFNVVKPVENAIVSLADSQTQHRVDKFRAAIDEQLKEGRQKVDDGKQQLEDGRRQIEDGRRELEEKRAELEDGRRQVEDGRRELEEKRKELEDGREKLTEARQTLDDGWKSIADAEAQLKDAAAQLDEGGKALAEAEIQLAPIRGLADRALSLIALFEDTGHRLPGAVGGVVQSYRDALQKYSDGRMTWYFQGEEYLDAVALVEQNRKLLTEGEAEYASSLAQFEDGERQLAEGERQLRDAEQQLADGFETPNSSSRMASVSLPTASGSFETPNSSSRMASVSLPRESSSFGTPNSSSRMPSSSLRTASSSSKTAKRSFWTPSGKSRTARPRCKTARRPWTRLASASGSCSTIAATRAICMPTPTPTICQS